MELHSGQKNRGKMSRRTNAYVPPPESGPVRFFESIDGIRPIPDEQRQRFKFLDENAHGAKLVYVAGDQTYFRTLSVAIVGSRKAGEDALKRASRLARELSDDRVIVVSGLATGIDTAAIRSALAHELGRIVAVIGTPLEKAYPAANKRLQEKIYTDHLLVTPFAHGMRTHRGCFPQRNQVMAALSDATVVIEAGETSGTIHQAAECQRLGRPLFFTKSLADKGLKWVTSFLETYENAHVMASTADVIERIESLS